MIHFIGAVISNTCIQSLILLLLLVICSTACKDLCYYHMLTGNKFEFLCSSQCGVVVLTYGEQHEYVNAYSATYLVVRNTLYP